VWWQHTQTKNSKHPSKARVPGIGRPLQACSRVQHTLLAVNPHCAVTLHYSSNIACDSLTSSSIVVSAGVAQVCECHMHHNTKFLRLLAQPACLASSTSPLIRHKAASSLLPLQANLQRTYQNTHQSTASTTASQSSKNLSEHAPNHHTSVTKAFSASLGGCAAQHSSGITMGVLGSTYTHAT